MKRVQGSHGGVGGGQPGARSTGWLSSQIRREGRALTDERSLPTSLRSGVAWRATKLRLSKEERLTRQTEAIGKTLRDAMQSKRSLGGQTMESIEAVFRAIDTDGSGDLDYDEFHTVRRRMYLGCSL